MTLSILLTTVVVGVLALQLLVLAGSRGRRRFSTAGRRLRGLGARLLDDERTVRRGVLAAVGTGFAIRLAWVVFATRAPLGFQDPAEYLRIAQGFLDGDMPTFQSGAHSAFFAPGYPLILAPFLWLADVTGWASPAFTASLINVVAASATVGLTAFLAGRWISPRSRVPAAWLVALSPGLVFFTSTAHAESVFTTVFLGILALVTITLDRGPQARARQWVAIGVVTGFAFLIRSPAVVVFLIPCMAAVSRGGGWRSALRPTVLMLAGSMLFLVPWTVRNGVQVGVWTPTSTSNALPPCEGHGPDAHAQFTHPTAAHVQECFHLSPYDDERLQDLIAREGAVAEGAVAEGGPMPVLGHPDEPRWYRERLREAAGWALTHPVDEVRLSALKVWESWEDEDRVIEAARNFSEGPDWAGRWSWPLAVAANVGLWIVEALAIAGLLTVRACRRALPVWGPVVAGTLLIVAGIAYPHYRNPVLPLVAALAGGFVAGPRHWRRGHLPATASP